jgi:hypothetical protein
MIAYNKNDYIIHDSFGRGQIIDIKGLNGNMKLIVHFEKLGQKVLLQKIAMDKICHNLKHNFEYKKPEENQIRLTGKRSLKSEKILESILTHVKKGNPVYKHKSYGVYYTRKNKFDAQTNTIKELITEIKTYIKIIDVNEMSSRRKSWVENFDELNNYININNKKPPTYLEGNYKDGGKINPIVRWYYKNLVIFNKGKMLDEKKEKFSHLVELFNQYSKRGNIKGFNSRLIQLKKYIDEKGFPSTYNKDGSRNKLKIFIDNNLQYYRSGKMSVKRYNSFKDIGLDFKNQERVGRKNALKEVEYVHILKDILNHVKKGASVRSHPESRAFYSKSRTISYFDQSSEIQELVDKIKEVSKKEKMNRILAVLNGILKHVKLNENISHHHHARYYYSRYRNYSVQNNKVKNILLQINLNIKNQKESLPLINLKNILKYVKLGNPIYQHPKSAVYYGRLRNIQNQSDETKSLINEIIIYKEANSRKLDPIYVLSDILNYVKSGGSVKDHNKCSYFFKRVDELEFLDLDIREIIQEIKYYRDLNNFEDEANLK